MIYSSWDTFNALLDDPVAYGFPAEDVRKANGSIWVDHLHPTSAVHHFLARDMFAFLIGQAVFDS
jgi:phospholipase/lecithinase/hemolysin